MELEAIAIVMAIIAMIVAAFVAGRRAGAQKVCHEGQVQYGATADRRFAVNIILQLNEGAFKVRLRLPRSESQRLAKAILNDEVMEVDGGTVGDRATRIPTRHSH
jgi:hypothetical protein